MESREKALLDMPAGLRRGELARLKWRTSISRVFQLPRGRLLFHDPIISVLPVIRQESPPSYPDLRPQCGLLVNDAQCLFADVALTL